MFTYYKYSPYPGCGVLQQIHNTTCYSFPYLLMAAQTQKRCAWKSKKRKKSSKRNKMRRRINESLLVTRAGDKGSWFRQEDFWPESFAEPKNPVSASGKKILNIPSNDLFCSTAISRAEYRNPVNRSQITVYRF